MYIHRYDFSLCKKLLKRKLLLIVMVIAHNKTAARKLNE
ncbi:hypothetical protein AZO1586I_272 [Bathymodiolus thermophilus thioautotrophic gill symbiont]|uniref:Uncharacterized protein n=2 Tax=sulfur-oxidizing symbionts TaxID=32036 RepID=A0A1H6MUI8_9GAMM|nr:hypothetical protein AZO1586I_272 [Bathymodiolus thermophilus thioautotrophic gill symbiont]CAC9527341.1 hypothetical protein [uncultured Gammaproteobacteria bacterium]SEI01335.1 hypothetical protein BAZSYMA_ACONTIG59793_0 [Bathymodiolus azoricus thioautotrophic gill symbiont]